MTKYFPELKVKIKSLGAEATFIRKEEKKARNDLQKQSLYLHRINVVRTESRKTQLAYAFLRGLGYSELEKIVREDNLPTRHLRSGVARMVAKYKAMPEGWNGSYEDWRCKVQEELKEWMITS